MRKSQACPVMLSCEVASSAGTPCTRRCCTFDNRGIGSSSIPEHFSAYKTGIMAADVRALMDHLGWARAHVMGMSLGGEHRSALCVDAPVHRSYCECVKHSVYHTKPGVLSMLNHSDMGHWHKSC